VLWLCQIKQSLLYLDGINDKEIKAAVAAHSTALEDIWQKCRTKEPARVLPQFHSTVTKTLRSLGATVSTGRWDGV